MRAGGVEVGDDFLEFGLVVFQGFEADYVDGEGFAPVAGGRGLDQQVDEGVPVFEIVGALGGRLAAVAAEGERIGRAVVAFGLGHFGGQGGELREDGRGDELLQAGEGAADGELEGAVELGEDDVVEEGVGELLAGEGDELAPLVAGGEHGGDEFFAVGEVAVAVEEDGFEGEAEGWVGVAEQHEGAACGFGVQGGGVVGGGEASAGAREDRQAACDFGAERVDGANVEPARVVEKCPAEGVRACERGLGEGAGGEVEGVGGLGLGAGGDELRKDAVAHFGGGLAGEGDGEDGGGVVDDGEQLEETLDEQTGFAGTGGGFDDEGGGGVEGLGAGFGVGNQVGDGLRHGGSPSRRGRGCHLRRSR